MHRRPLVEALIAREAARLEALHGDLETALALFDATIDSQFQAGNVTHLAATIANLAVLFDRLDRPETAATMYGTSTHKATIAVVAGLPTVLDHLRAALGDVAFDEQVAAGAAIEPGAAGARCPTVWVVRMGDSVIVAAVAARVWEPLI